MRSQAPVDAVARPAAILLAGEGTAGVVQSGWMRGKGMLNRALGIPLSQVPGRYLAQRCKGDSGGRAEMHLFNWH